MSDKKKSPGLTIRNSTAEFLIFTHQAGESDITVRHENNTIWLTQKLMAELFDVSVPTVNEHLKNTFKSGELQTEAAIRKFRTTAGKLPIDWQAALIKARCNVVRGASPRPAGDPRFFDGD